MENVIIDEITKKKLSTWKRIFIFFLDSLMIAGLFIILFYLIGDIVIRSVAKSDIEGINNIYEQECLSQDVPFHEGLYGVYELDKDAYVEILYNDPENTKTFDEIMEIYNNKYYEIDTNIQSYTGYSDYYQGFTATYYIVLLSSLFISSFVFLLLIPLTNRKNKTITMFITHTSLVNDKTNVIANNYQVLGRFFCIYAIEIALGYAVVGIIGLLFVILINIFIISISKKKKSIHDFMLQVHVEKDEYSYTE